MNLKTDNRGISLPMTIGLLLLVFVLTATVNELVIRALRASHQIEASDKAYFAAEAGIEDALYELSAHGAGYETQSLETVGVRNDNFSGDTLKWENEWEIKNKGLNSCATTINWWSFNPSYCGKLRAGEKLVINLFSDYALSSAPPGGISLVAPDVQPIGISEIKISFRLPPSLMANNPSAFSDSKLHIDNDGDLGTSPEVGPENWPGLNEDGADNPPPFFPYPPNACPYSGGVAIDDNDCDQLEDEDSPEDPVILWKAVDGDGHSFQPLRGCKGDPRHSSHPANDNAVLCEKSFTLFALPDPDELSVSFNHLDYGVDQDGQITTLFSFLATHAGYVQIEMLVASPMEAVSMLDGYTIPIPYFEYGIGYDTTLDEELPSSFFALKSDGYYQDFKQSITTNVVPRATTRLLDLTIIQQ